MYERLIWVPIGLLFTWPFAGTLAGVDEQVVLGVELVAVTVFVLGLDAYWWWRLFVREGPRPEALPGVPELSELASKSKLMHAMTLHGGDVAVLERGMRGTRSAMLEFKFWQSLILLGVVGGFWLGALGLLDGLPIEPGVAWVLMVITPTLILIIRMLTGMLEKAVSAGAEQVGSLGLELVELPQLTLISTPNGIRPVPAGRTAVRGARHGREVEIVFEEGESVTCVRASHVPSFDVSSDDGKLQAGQGAPDTVVDSLRSLPRARRWRGAELSAGDDLVKVERTSNLAEGWLYDLWLTERLLEALGVREAGAPER